MNKTKATIQAALLLAASVLFALWMNSIEAGLFFAATTALWVSVREGE